MSGLHSVAWQGCIVGCGDLKKHRFFFWAPRCHQPQFVVRVHWWCLNVHCSTFTPGPCSQFLGTTIDGHLWVSLVISLVNVCEHSSYISTNLWYTHSSTIFYALDIPRGCSLTHIEVGTFWTWGLKWLVSGTLSPSRSAWLGYISISLWYTPYATLVFSIDKLNSCSLTHSLWWTFPHIQS
jgi:hypothetical protein